MGDKRLYSVIIISLLAFAFGAFIYAAVTDSYVGNNGVAFLSPSESSHTYLNRAYLLINVTANLSGLPGVNNLTVYVYNSTVMCNASNSTSPVINYITQLAVPDGVYNITVNASNVTFSNFTIRYNITVDTLKPNITINSPAANANISAWNSSINMTFRDTYINYTAVTIYNFTGSLVSSANITSTNTTLNVTIDGRYSIFATAYDLAGNSNTTSRNVTIDTISPVIIVSSPINNTNYYANQSININFLATETNPFNYWYFNSSSGTNITFVPGVNLTSISYPSLGWYNLTFYANDSTAHLTTLRIMINITSLSGTSTMANSSSSALDVNATMSTIVVPYNSTLKNVSLTNTSQVVAFDLSQVLDNGTVTSGNNFSLVTQGTYNYTVYIPQFVNITGGSSWDGKVNLPTINVSTTFTAPSSGTTNVVVDIGSSVHLNFSSPVKVVIGGMQGKSAAWSSSGSALANIATICNNTDSPTNIDAVTTRECYNSTGADLIIWTYHFTSFAAYTPYVAAAETTLGGGSSSAAASENLTAGYTKLFSTGDTLSFKFDSKSFMFMLLYTKGNNATIQFSPNLQSATLAVGEEKNFDLNKDGKNDIYVKINSISGIKADATLKFITETPAVLATETPIETGVGAIVGETVDKIVAWSLAKKITVSLGVIIAIALIVVGIIFLRKNSGNSRAREHVKTFEFARK
ncbi:MAG: hypothetical protein AABX17_01255 [Nanoarchaeota archaeon]